MLFFRKASAYRELKTQIDAFRGDLDALSAQLRVMSERFGMELGTLRQDFHELIVVLKESTTEVSIETEASRASGEAHFIAHGDVADLADRIDGVVQKTDALRDTLLQINTTVADGFGEMHKQINDARKDISNRISYAVSRLRA